MKSAPLQGSQWPEDGLESVPACPVCRSADRHVLYDGLRDRVFRVAPGSWRLYECDACRSAWLDPRPNAASLPMAYQGYFTHDEGKIPVLVRRRGIVRKIIHDALNAYLSQRYGFHRAPLGHAWIARLLPPLRAAADTLCRHLPLAPEGGRLLDVGCGNGLFLGIAREMGWQAEGLDFDQAAVARARAQGFDVRVGGGRGARWCDRPLRRCHEQPRTGTCAGSGGPFEAHPRPAEARWIALAADTES